MSKARLIAISGICSAAAVVCMMLASVAKWAALILAVVAAVATVIPMLVHERGLLYSLLVFAVSSALGVFAAFSFGNVVLIVPIVTFCMPFAIVKVYGESVKVTASMEQTETLEDPFGQGQDTHVVEVQFNGRKRLPAVVKWLLYYVVLEFGIGLTLLAAYLLLPEAFNQFVANKYFFLALAASQLVVIPYDFLLRGCLIGTTKLLHKIIK